MGSMIDTQQHPETRLGDNSFLRMPPGHHPSTLADALDFWSCRTDPVCVSENILSS